MSNTAEQISSSEEQQAAPATTFNVTIDADSLQTPFIDIVQIEMNAENVKLNLIQVLPGSTLEIQNTKLLYRIALSWPHFIRFIKLGESLITEKKGEMKEAVVRLVDSLEET